MNTKTVNQLALGTLLIIGSFFAINYFRKSKSNQNNLSSEDYEDESIIKNNNVTSTLKYQNLFPLSTNSKNLEVLETQKWLNKKGYASPKLVEDGIFGEKTKNVIKKMYENPYELAIQEYVDNSIWEKGFSVEKISKEFYNKFIKNG